MLRVASDAGAAVAVAAVPLRHRERLQRTAIALPIVTCRSSRSPDRRCSRDTARSTCSIVISGPVPARPLLVLHGGWGYAFYPFDAQIAALPDAPHRDPGSHRLRQVAADRRAAAAVSSRRRRRARGAARRARHRALRDLGPQRRRGDRRDHGAAPPRAGHRRHRRGAAHRSREAAVARVLRS